MTFHLTLDAVKTAAREAYAKGELGFQKGEEHCRYVGTKTGAPCAIGAAMSEEFRQKLVSLAANGKSIGSLKRSGYVSMPEKEFNTISYIQRSHDDIVKRAAEGLDTTEAEADFKRLIGIE